MSVSACMEAASVGIVWRPSDPMQGLFYSGKWKGVLTYRQLIEMTKSPQNRNVLSFIGYNRTGDQGLLSVMTPLASVSSVYLSGSPQVIRLAILKPSDRTTTLRRSGVSLVRRIL